MLEVRKAQQRGNGMLDLDALSHSLYSDFGLLSNGKSPAIGAMEVLFCLAYSLQSATVAPS